MQNENKSEYGFLTIGADSPLEKKLKIVDVVRAVFKDFRLISVAGIEDGTYCITIENPESTGRNAKQSIWVSEESFTGFIVTSLMYLQAKGTDFEKLLQDVFNGKSEIDFVFSENLKNDFGPCTEDSKAGE